MSNFGDKFKSIIDTLAPTVATALGGPFAGTAVSALIRALGLEPGTDQATVEATVLAANPDDLAKVKVAEIEFQQTLANLGVEKEQLAYADTASARGREVSLKDRTPSILAFAFVVGWFGVQAFIMVHVIDASMRDIVLRTLGTMDMALGLILGYYFGSSAGSAQKMDILGKISSNTPTK